MGLISFSEKEEAPEFPLCHVRTQQEGDQGTLTRIQSMLALGLGRPASRTRRK